MPVALTWPALPPAPPARVAPPDPVVGVFGFCAWVSCAPPLSLLHAGDHDASRSVHSKPRRQRAERGEALLYASGGRIDIMER
jgi:hypothetical protein